MLLFRVNIFPAPCHHNQTPSLYSLFLVVMMVQDGNPEPFKYFERSTFMCYHTIIQIFNIGRLQCAKYRVASLTC